MEITHSAVATEECFLAFHYMRFDFVIPLSDVVRVADGSPENAAVIGTDDSDTARCYVISNVGDRVLAISADEVYGLVQIRIENQFDLPAEVRSKENAWIFGVADLGEHRPPAFLLDCHQLLALFCERAGE